MHCDECGYAANLERAETGRKPATGRPKWPARPRRSRSRRPGTTSIEQVCKLLGCQPSQMIKTLIYLADGKPVAVLMRGDHEANEGKIRRALRRETLEAGG